MTRFAPLLLCVSLASAHAGPQAHATAAIEETRPMNHPALTPFEIMDKALAARDVPAWKSAWHPQGWAENLVGPSGLAGSSAARQVKADGWRMVPTSEPQSIAGSEHVWVVAIGIVSPDGRTLDALFAVVEQRDDAVHVVGAGEKPDEVHALAMRLVEGKPLAPPRGE